MSVENWLKDWLVALRNDKGAKEKEVYRVSEAEHCYDYKSII